MKDSITGTFGAILAFLAPFFEFLGLAGQAIAGVAGLFLLFLSIKHKMMEIENEKKVKEHLENKNYRHEDL